MLIGGDEAAAVTAGLAPGVAEDAGREPTVLTVRPVTAGVGLDGVDWIAQYVVDRTGDRVGTVDGRSSVLHDFDAGEHLHRIVVRVEGVADDALIEHAVPVDEAQRRLRSQAVDVGRIAVGSGEAVLDLGAGGDVVAIGQRQNGWNAVQDVVRAHQARLLDRSLIEGYER